TAAQLRSLQILEAYDLTPVRDRLRERGLLPDAVVDEALFEFRRYLGLRLGGHGPFAMCSEAGGVVWDTWVLFTRLYANLCQQALGYFVHHTPVTAPGHRPPPTRQEFDEAYRHLYGEPGRLWQPSAAGTPTWTSPEAQRDALVALADKLGDFATTLPREEQQILQWLLALAAAAT